MPLLSFAFLLLCCSYFSFCKENNPVVELKDGKVKGVFLQSRGGREFSAFMGIPYADVPERFELPKPVFPWSGILEATAYGSMCAQYELRTQKIEGAEDCLFVNVFTPDIKRRLPVLVYIHGGGFQCGSSNENGPDYLMDEDVVFVTLNYRVGAFGFLSTGDEVLPGNLGLKDQRLALQWVQRNIERFGGDAEAVTIFGESAGGVAVSLHILSPQSLGLFRSAICISGTALNNWMFGEHPQKSTLALAQRLNCSVSTSLEIKSCLQEKSISDVYASNADLKLVVTLDYLPTLEPNSPHAFLAEAPRELYKEGRFAKIPLLVATNADEGLFIYSVAIMTNPALIKEVNENWLKLAPSLFHYDEPPYSTETQDKISEAIKSYYFENNPPASDSTFQNLTDVFSDSGFMYGTRETALLHGKHAATYTAILTFNGTWSYISVLGHDKVLGMAHADDLQYVFSYENYPQFPPNSDTLMASKRLVKTYANFATFGDPNLDREKKDWEPLSGDEIATGEVKWMYLKNTCQHKAKTPLDKRMAFWDQISKLITTNERLRVEL